LLPKMSPKTKKILLTMVFAIVSTSIFSQKPLPPQSIPQLLDSIKSVMKRDHIAGLMLGMVTKDCILFSGGFGWADVASHRKVTSQTRFRMGSVTKMFVSLAVMKLIEEGKLQLDTKLNEVAPEVPFENPWEDTHPVRIVHLLEHTSGFDDITLNNMYSFDTTAVSGVSMTTLHRHSLVCRWKPGERSAYSNPNYAVLGYIIEKITGEKYDDYLREIILQPIGMTESDFNNGSKFSQKDTKEYIIRHHRPVEVPHVTLLTGPQGALWSCADDMIKFIRMFLCDGKPIVSPETIISIETAHSSLAAKKGLTTGYALGNRNCFIHQKIPFRGHDGLAGTCYSGCYYNRELGVGFAIASNSNKPNYEIENLIVSFFERNEPAKKIQTEKINEKQLASFEGWYQFDSPRNEISGFMDRLQNLQKVSSENGVLYAKPLFQDAVELQPSGNGTFMFANVHIPTILFTRNEDGEAVMYMGGNYYRKVSGISALTSRIVAGAVLLILISSLVNTLAWIIRAVRRRENFPAVVMQCLPALGLISLFTAVRELLHIRDFSYELASLRSATGTSITIFVGTAMFGLCSVLYAIYTLYGFTRLQERPSYYRMALAVSLVIATVFLWHHDWIGLRTWAL